MIRTGEDLPALLGVGAVKPDHDRHAHVEARHCVGDPLSHEIAPGDTTGQDVGEVWYIVTPGMQLGDEPHHAEEGHEAGEEATSATPASS